MAEQFHLGFDIDTRPLAQAKQAAQDAAQAIGKLGDAEQALAQKAGVAADQQRKLQDELKKTGQAVGQATPADAAQKAQAFSDAMNRTKQSLLDASQAAASMTGAMGSGGGGMVGGVSTLVQGFGRFASALGPTGLILGAVAAGVGFLGKQAFDGAASLAVFADKAALLEARLKNALGSTSDAKTTMKALYDQTQQTGLGFEAAADSFNRLARNAEALGASKGQLLQLSETIQKLGAVSGASRGEIASGMIQLSQALASGKLNGDELRSIMENMPALAKAIADGLGVSVGQIRAMGAAGELTGAKVFNSILKSSQRANEEFASLPDTVERANQRAADSYDKLLATLGEKWNASGFVKGVTNLFTDLINKADKALQPQGIGQQIAGLEAKRANFVTLGGRNSEREIASIDARLNALRAQAQTEVSEVGAANEKSDAKIARAFITQGAEVGSNEFDDFNKKLSATTLNVNKVRDALEGIQIRMKSGLATDEDKALVPALTRQLALGNAELADMIVGVDRLKRDLSDSRMAQAMGGGGGGASIVQKAIEQQRQAASKIPGGGALGAYISAGVEQAAMGAQGQIDTISRQATAQARLTGQIGMTRDATREMDVANESAIFRFEKFGTLKGKVIDDFMAKYTAALRANKEAIDANVSAQANYNNMLEVGVINAQRSAVGDPGQQRVLAATMRANRNPATYQSEMAKFEASEALNAENQVSGAERSAIQARRLVQRFPNERARQLAELDISIGNAQQGMTPEQRLKNGDRVAQAMTIEDTAKFDASQIRAEQSLERQIKNSAARNSLIGVYSDELRVQSAVLEKQLQLEEQGLSVEDERYKRQIALTAELARQEAAFDKQRQQIADINQILDGTASSVRSSFVDALDNSFKTGEDFAQSFFNSIGDMARRASIEMTYEIAVKPLMTLAANAAKMGLTNMLGLGAGPSVGAGVGAGTVDAGSVAISPFLAANGLAIGQGGVQAFANGGAFTNGLFDSPTLFRFANGGALGVMGEAGPEAVMPLRRGSDGKLGVASQGGGGGDVQIVVNDMRTSKDSAPVEASSSTGPGGMKQIQIMVRDEVRRSMGAGEFDRTMQANFGMPRQIARK